MASASLRILRRNINGADLWILENRFIRITLWPEHGAAILGSKSLEHRLDLIWKNPLLQPPRRSLLAQPVTGGSDLCDVLDGSWFISLPTGWFPAKHFGAPIGAHGEFRSLPFEAEVVEESPERVRIKVVGKSICTPFLRPRTQVEDRIGCLNSGLLQDPIENLRVAGTDWVFGIERVGIVAGCVLIVVEIVCVGCCAWRQAEL